MSDGWQESAEAWIADMGERGDYSREFVLDAPMMARIRGRGFTTALDVGCGEGRFCRMMREAGVRTTGIDPTQELIDQARRRDPAGAYKTGLAEALDFPDRSFDLVVSYLTLIDISGLMPAIAEMTRVLKPGGSLLIANLNSFSTAGRWQQTADGQSRFCIDHYLDARAEWVSWRGIHIQNWHRPLSAYMAPLLAQGLVLRHFAEPEPVGGDPAEAIKYRRAPYLMLMEWLKPAS